jgi:hypothetical protein
VQRFEKQPRERGQAVGRVFGYRSAMVRGSRSGVMLLWLLLALLPLRGWAQGTMALAAPAAPTAHAAPQQALPCHGAMVEHPAGHPGGPPTSQEGDSTAGTACSHCDLCHAAAAPNEVPAQATQALPDLAPAGLVLRPAAASVPDALFRPPRP